MQLSSISQQTFKNPKEFQGYLYTKVVDKLDLIFRQNSFDIKAHMPLIKDGVQMAQGMIDSFSQAALLEGRELELEKVMEKVSETVSFNIMEMSKLNQEMDKVSVEQAESSKEDLQEIGRKIKQLQIQTTQKLSGIASTFFEGSSLVDQKSIRDKNRAVNNANRTYHTGFAKHVETIIAKREASMEIMRKYLAIAEKRGCSPAQVTQKDLKEYNEEIRRRNEEELLALEKKVEVKPKEKKKEKKTTSKIATVVKKTFQEKKDPSKVPPQEDSVSQKTRKSPGKIRNQTPKKEEIQQARTEFMLPLHQRKVIETFRVIRWKESNPATIREFKDRDKMGKEIKKYAHMKDEEIARQRIFHYLPGPEQLLGQLYRDIYTFPTDKGCGVYASLVMNEEEQGGFLYFGEGKIDKKVYHKYFEMNPYETKEFISHFKDREEVDEKEEENGIWESEKVTFLTEMNDEGVLTVKFIGEAHFIKIYPIKKELFPDICLKAT